jgi:hypothetical protein
MGISLTRKRLLLLIIYRVINQHILVSCGNYYKSKNILNTAKLSQNPKLAFNVIFLTLSREREASTWAHICWEKDTEIFYVWLGVTEAPVKMGALGSESYTKNLIENWFDFNKFKIWPKWFIDNLKSTRRDQFCTNFDVSLANNVVEYWKHFEFKYCKNVVVATSETSILNHHNVWIFIV